MLCPSCGHDNIEGTDRCDNCMKPLYGLDVPRADATAGLVRSVMEDDLRQLGQSKPVTVRPDQPAIEVTRLMKEAQTGCALVLNDQSQLVGIFTEHDVLCKLMSPNEGAKDSAVSDLMSRNPEALRETDSVAISL